MSWRFLKYASIVSVQLLVEVTLVSNLIISIYISIIGYRGMDTLYCVLLEFPGPFIFNVESESKLVEREMAERGTG